MPDTRYLKISCRYGRKLWIGHALLMPDTRYLRMVPTGRLELPRLAPLPPQDSVSTNFTTSALLSLAYFGTSAGLAAPAGVGVPAGPGAGCGTSLGFAGTVLPLSMTPRSITPLSITPCGAPECCDPKYVSATLVTKNTVARMAVVRDRKLAEPAAPNRLPDDPLPNAAPMSAPL